MENKELLKELEKRFKEEKEELGFKATLDEIDEIFFIRDSILSQKYVGTKVSSQIRHRMIDNYNSWIGHIHNLVMPPQHMIFMNESQMFDEDEKKEIIELIRKTMLLISKNSVIALTKDKKLEGPFIDEALNFWETTFKVELTKIFKKIEKGWEKKD